MLHLAICDDDQTQIKYLTALLKEWADARGISLPVSTYESSESFLFHYEEDKTADLLLLDIQMKEMDGIALARKIRETNQKVQIVFITGYPDFMSEGYEVCALHYLLKPVQKEKLFDVLDRACAVLSENGRKILIETDRGLTALFLNEILYVEASAHTVIIQTQQDTFRGKLSLGEIKEELGAGFVSSHRSYLVSLRHICRITTTDLMLDNGLSVPLSRRHYRDVNCAFIEYYKGGQK